MALTESSAIRTDDASGKNIKTFLDADGDHIQAIALVDDVGDQTGIAGNKFQVDVVASGLPSGAATAAAQASLLAELEGKADLSETQPVSNATLPLPTGAATSAAQATLLAELQLKADLTETQPVSNAALSVVGGGVEATAQRVTIANDSTGVISVDDGGGSLTVDQATHDNLNANANIQVGDADVANGNPVPVSDAGGSITVDGAVTIQEPLSVDDNGGSLTIDNAALSVVGGGAEATALRVTVANDSTGVLSVDDGGGSLTVDTSSLPLPTGAATAAAQASLLTELQLKADLTETQLVEEQETVPTDASKNNPSFVLSYTGSNLTGVAMTIGGSTYNKTLGYTGDNLTSVSVWVAA